MTAPKLHIVTRENFLQPEDRELISFIMGPDLEQSGFKVLHFRCVYPVYDAIKNLPYTARLELLNHMEVLLADFKERILGGDDSRNPPVGA